MIKIKLISKDIYSYCKNKTVLYNIKYLSPDICGFKAKNDSYIKFIVFTQYNILECIVFYRIIQYIYII